jgi:dTDP-4-amino-4,6-dideoxygalactose transaminase
MHVPFLDLKAQYKQIESEVVPVVTEVMAAGMFIGGPQVTGFETEFAAFCESKYCIGVGSGTDALRFALMAAGIGPGDAVITAPNTFIATTEAISQVGATPIFVDVDPQTYTMDPIKLEQLLNERYPQLNLSPEIFDRNERSGFHRDKLKKPNTPNKLFNQSTNYLAPHASSLEPRPKAVIPIHLYGQPADMDPILEIARQYDLVVIEDACQAHGASYKNRKAGSLSTAGCFSFYPGKNLGAFGEAGAVVTQDEEMAQKMRMIRDHGQAQKYFHDLEGYNGRLDAIQAAVLRIKLKRLQGWNRSRRKNAAFYTERLQDVPGITLPAEAEFAESVYHLYVILADNRDGLQEFLSEKGIATGLHYPLPLHRQKAYAHLGHKKGDFPVAESAAERLLSLPMYPELTEEQIDYVCTSIKEFMKR